MIQRIQSIYLLLAAVACIVCLCLPVGSLIDGDGAAMKVYNLCVFQPDGTRNFIVAPLLVILCPTIFLSIYTIFIYNNRKMQARFANFAILLLVGWYIVYGVLMLTLPSTGYSLEWAVFLPLVAIILCWMAHRGIMHDERLVRAADRIR